MVTVVPKQENNEQKLHLGHHFEFATFLCPSPFKSTWFYVESALPLGFNIRSGLTQFLADYSLNLKLGLATIKNRKVLKL